MKPVFNTHTHTHTIDIKLQPLSISSLKATTPFESTVTSDIGYEFSNKKKDLYKNFFSDLIDTISKKREYDEICSIFHPDKSFEYGHQLDLLLNNSIEFVVLSHRKLSDYIKNIDKRILSYNHQYPLYSIGISKNLSCVKPSPFPYYCSQQLLNIYSLKHINMPSSFLSKESPSNINSEKLCIPTFIYNKAIINYKFTSNLLNKTTLVSNTVNQLKHISCKIKSNGLEIQEYRALKKYNITNKYIFTKK